MDAGEHVVSWNGRDDAGRSVPTGTYFAQLGIGSQRRVEKVSRIR
jgi:flagellar hook assembly protein FlgD